MSMISALREDFRRGGMTFYDKLSLTVIRLNQAVAEKALPIRLIGFILDALWLRLIIGGEIPPTVRIGPGLRLPHSARMVIINPRCAIGSGATIYHGVTLGVWVPKTHPSLRPGLCLRNRGRVAWVVERVQNRTSKLEHAQLQKAIAGQVSDSAQVTALAE